MLIASANCLSNLPKTFARSLFVYWISAFCIKIFYYIVAAKWTAQLTLLRD